MPVQILVKENTAKTKNKKAAAAGQGLAQKVDRYGTVKAELDKVAALIKEEDKLKTELRGQADALAGAAVEAHLEGEHYTVSFGPKPNTRFATNLKALHKKLGDNFYELISVSLTELDKVLTETEREPFIGEKAGSRRILSVVQKEVAEAA